MLQLYKKLTEEELQRLKREVIIHHAKFTVPPKLQQRFLQMVAGFGREMEQPGQSAEHYEEQRGAAKAPDDIRMGKYAELVTAYLLRTCGFPHAELDFGIRKGDKKGWVPDIIYTKSDPNYPDVHVKGCNPWTQKYIARKHEKYSWTFQWNKGNTDSSEKGRDKLFEKLDSWDLVSCVFVSVMQAGKVDVVATGPWCLLNPYLKNPSLSKYLGQKKCLYYSDVVKLAGREELATY
jgi:hypothetical protein